MKKWAYSVFTYHHSKSILKYVLLKRSIIFRVCFPFLDLSKTQILELWRANNFGTREPGTN